VAYLSGRGGGNRCFCRRELITIVTPLSRPGSAKTAASVCLYSVYKKHERSLFTAALEQTSNVPPSSGCVRRQACGLPYPASGRRSRPSVALHVCFLQVRHGAGDPAAARRFMRPSLPRPMGGRRWFPGPSSGGRWPLCFPGHAPPYPPGSFGHATADYVDRSQAALGSRHLPGTAPGPAGDRPSTLCASAGDPTPITQVKVRTRAKSTTGFSYFQTAYRFSGCCLTSLQQTTKMFYKQTFMVLICCAYMHMHTYLHVCVSVYIVYCEKLRWLLMLSALS